MHNLYNLIEKGTSFEDLKKISDILNLIVFDTGSNEVMPFLDRVYSEVTSAIKADTDNDFDAGYYLVTIAELEKYFNDRGKELKGELELLEGNKYGALKTAANVVKNGY